MVTNGTATITKCDSSASGTLSIPATLGGNPVTAIEEYAFSACAGLTSITIPGSVTAIGKEVFRFCSGLKSIHYERVKTDREKLQIDQKKNPFLNTRTDR